MPVALYFHALVALTKNASSHLSWCLQNVCSLTSLLLVHMGENTTPLKLGVCGLQCDTYIHFYFVCAWALVLITHLCLFISVVRTLGCLLSISLLFANIPHNGVLCKHPCWMQHLQNSWQFLLKPCKKWTSMEGTWVKEEKKFDTHVALVIKLKDVPKPHLLCV